MNYIYLSDYVTPKLKEIASSLNLKYSGSREAMIEKILKEKDYNYKILEQLGDEGTDAKTFAVKDRLTGKIYAMKIFKKTKKKEHIILESELQYEAGDVAPKIIDVDLDKKYIVMEKLDKHLIDLNHKKISFGNQKQLIKIFKELDDKKIFHADANPLNFMLKDKILYVIDFGMSKRITAELEKKLGTSRPNFELSNLAFVLKLISMNYPPESYAFLVKQIDTRTREKFQI